MSEEQRPRRGFLFWVLFGLPVCLIAVGLAAVWANNAFEAPGPLAQDKIIEIRKGTGLQGIARLLEAEGVLQPYWLFALGVRLDDKAGALQAGEFRFPAAVSMREAMAILESGKVVQYSLTLPEGHTTAQALTLVREAEALEGEIAGAWREGALLPETYSFVRRESRETLLDRMARAQQSALAELWEQRAPDLPLASPEEALILASIVEKETGVAEERPLVASVFINRLRKGMRLQSDPTVVYGITLGQEPLGRPLSRKDLNTPTPYNTYAIDRLPPGPIANPGKAAIAAVLRPDESDYLYFVADGTGGHAFAKTLAEHNRNVAKWRKIQRQSQSDG